MAAIRGAQFGRMILASALATTMACQQGGGPRATMETDDRESRFDTTDESSELFVSKGDKSTLDGIFSKRYGAVPSSLVGNTADLAAKWKALFPALEDWESTALAQKLVAVEHRQVSLPVMNDWLAVFPNIQVAIRNVLGETARSVSLPLEIINDQLVARDGEIASGGIELPSDFARSTTCLRLYRVDADGREHPVPAQFHSLGMAHRDGSLKWVLAQTRIQNVSLPPADRAQDAAGNAYYYSNANPNHLREDGVTALLQPKSLKYRLRSGGSSFCEPGPVEPTPVTATRVGRELHIDSGPMQVIFDLERFSLPNRLTVDGRTLIQGGTTQTFTSTRNRLSAELEECLVHSGSREDALLTYGLAGALAPGSIQAPECQALSTESRPNVAGYADLFGGPVQGTIEEDGPIRTVVRFERVVRADGTPLQAGDLGYVIRVYVGAAARLMHVEYTAISHDALPTRINSAAGQPKPGTIPSTREITQWNLGWNVDLGEQPETVNYGFLDNRSAALTDIGDTQVVSASAAYSSTLEQMVPDYANPVPHTRMRTALITQDPAVTPMRNQSYASGWVQLAGASASVTLAMRNFWQEFPKALSYQNNGRMQVGLWPSGAHVPQVLAGGRAKTYQFAIGANTDPQRVSAATRAPLRLTPTPEYASRVERDFPFVPSNDASFPTQARLLHSTEYMQTLGGLLLGDADFGDIAGDGQSFPHSSSDLLTTMANTYDIRSSADFAPFNGYRGAALTPLLYSRQSGHQHAFRIGSSMVLHALDRDIGNWAPEEPWPTPGYPNINWPVGGHELYNGRPRDHLSLSMIPSNIYQWYQHLTYYYFMTGDRRIVDLLSQTVAGPWLRVSAQTGAARDPDTFVGRHQSLMHSQLLSIWKVIGGEPETAEFEPGAYCPQNAEYACLVPTRESMPPRTDSCGSTTPAGEITPTAQCTVEHARDLFAKIQRGVQGIADAVDWDAHDLDRNYVRSPSPTGARYELSGFTSTYPVEMFSKYYELTGSDIARRSVLRSADYFFGMYMSPTGVMRYARGPSSVPNPANPMVLLWAREDETPAWGQMYSPGPLAFMASGDERFLDLSRSVGDWLYNYVKEGGRSSMEIWAPSILFTFRAAGRNQDDFRVPTGKPFMSMPYAQRVQELESQVTNSATWSSGPYGYESAEPGRTRGLWVGAAQMSGPYDPVRVNISRCRMSLEIMRAKINSGDVAGARAWNTYAGGLLGGGNITDRGGCAPGESEGEMFRSMRRQLGL